MKITKTPALLFTAYLIVGIVIVALYQVQIRVRESRVLELAKITDQLITQEQRFKSEAVNNMFLSYYSYDLLNEHYSKLIKMNSQLTAFVEQISATSLMSADANNEFENYQLEAEKLRHQVADFRSGNATVKNSFIYLTSLFVEYSEDDQALSISPEELSSIYRITSRIIKMKGTIDSSQSVHIRTEIKKLKQLQEKHGQLAKQNNFSIHAEFIVDNFPQLIESFKVLTSPKRATFIKRFYRHQSRHLDSTRHSEYIYLAFIIAYLAFSALAFIYQLSKKGRYKLLSQTDKLTQFRNRSAYDEFLLTTLKNFRLEQKPSHLLVADIDKFKPINDTYGHKTGDDVLRTVAQLISENVRDKEALFRYGGEEFTIISTDMINISNLSERIRVAIEKFEFDIVGHLTVSIGVTDFRADDTPTSIFERADNCLYNAKENGRNRVEYDLIEDDSYLNVVEINVN